jgi:hypothetical protein
MLKHACILGLALGLAACGGEGGSEASDAAAPEATAPAPLDAPDQGTDTPAPVQPPAPAEVVMPTHQPGTFASQDLALRVESAALLVTRRTRDGDGGIRLGLAMTIANVGSEPFSIAMTEGGVPNAMLPNGNSLPSSGQRWEMSGLLRCQYDTAECRVRQPAAYTEIAPNEMLSVNIEMNGSFGAAQASGLAGVATANLHFRLHYIQGETDRVINVSLPNMPIQNQITN